MDRNPLKTQNQPNFPGNCRRCGECCRKGGPCLHNEDRPLVDGGIIPLRDLYTIRQGETVYENVRDTLSPAKTDLIKIKSRNGSRACIYLSESGGFAECRAYRSRPLECRALDCRNTREIEKIYDRDRLTRKDLLSGIEGLWELVADHQDRCDFKKLGIHVGKLNTDAQKESLEAIREALAYDLQIRTAVAEKAGVDPEITDFLFGRPLTETFVMFGLRVVMDENRFRLAPLR